MYALAMKQSSDNSLEDTRIFYSTLSFQFIGKSALQDGRTTHRWRDLICSLHIHWEFVAKIPSI